MAALPCLKKAKWNKNDQLESSTHFDCDMACYGEPADGAPSVVVAVTNKTKNARRRRKQRED